MCHPICSKCFAYSFVPVSLCSVDHLLQEVAHGRFVLLKLVFLAELVHESVGELFSVVSDDVATHTIVVDDMLRLGVRLQPTWKSNLLRLGCRLLLQMTLV